MGRETSFPPLERLSKQPQCRCSRLDARMHACKHSKINRWRWRRRCGCDSDSSFTVCLHSHLQLTYMIVLYHVPYWSPPTSLVRHPPGSPNASPDSGPQSLILTVVTVPVPRGTHPDPVRQYLALLYHAPADPQSRQRPPARGMPYAPRSMPALLETRGYTVLRPCVLHATQSINRQGRAPVGLRPELPRLPGGRLQLTAAIHVRPCSPARTNTTLFQRPSWNRQKGWGRSCP